MRTEEEVRLGSCSPSALALTSVQLPLHHLHAPTWSRDAQGKEGPVFSHLSLFDCQVVFWGNDLPIPSGVALTWGGLLKL